MTFALCFDLAVMRFLTLYLVGYFVLLIGAAWALWESGILSEIPGVWIGDRRDHRDRPRHHAGRGVEPARSYDTRVAKPYARRPAQAFRGTVCVTAQTACRPYGRAFSFSSSDCRCVAPRAARTATSRFPASISTASSRSTRARSPTRLQTKRGSRLPWGRKRFFDRSAFEADLKRIEAFYRDRGFPDARVTSFDVAAQ